MGAHSGECAPFGVAGCVSLCVNAHPLSEGQAYARAYAYCGFLGILRSMHTSGERGEMLESDAMTDSGAVLPWLVIRQDDNGNRYRVGRYATQDEAQKIADGLDRNGHKQLYWVERTSRGARP